MIHYCRDHLINRKYKIKWKRITENVSELICSKNNISESKPLNISVYVMMFPNNLLSFLCCIRSFLPCWHCCSCALSCGHTGTGYQGSVGGCLCAVPYRPLLQFTWSITTTGSDLIPHFFYKSTGFSLWLSYGLIVVLFLGQCQHGYFCQGGSTNPAPLNTTGYLRNGPCPQGHFCPSGTLMPLPCPAGSIRSLTGVYRPTHLFDSINL